LATSTKFKERYDTWEKKRKNVNMSKGQQHNMTEKEYDSLVRETQVTPVHLPGILASWSPDGLYKPACLLDHCRFRAHRPPTAERIEQKYVLTKRVFDIDSCAEWAAYLQIASVRNNMVSVIEASPW
jgi:hypothetical protein